MIRRNASLLLAVAIIALGTVQASAELVYVDPSTYADGAPVTTVLAPSGSPLANGQFFTIADSNPSVTLSGIVLAKNLGGSLWVFAAETNLLAPHGYAESWQGGWGTGASPNYAGYAMGLRFYKNSAWTSVPYAEVDFQANSSGDRGWLRAWSDSGTPDARTDDVLLAQVAVDLTAGAGTTGTAVLDADLDGNGTPFSYITATAYGSGVNVLITEVRYGDGPELAAVPEPASVISVLLGCVGLVLFRRRRS